LIYIVECEGGVLNRCLVRINNVDVIAVRQCLTKDEAIVRAADAAVKLLPHHKITVLNKLG